LLALFFYHTAAFAPDAVPMSLQPPGTVMTPLRISLTGEFWNAMQSRPEKSSRSVPGVSASDRFRLAGTFSIEGLGVPQPKAILDDTLKHDQFIVAEGDRLDEVTIKKIFYDHVILETPSGSRDIWMEFAGQSQTGTVSVVSNQVVATTGGTNRFGCAKVQDNRWQFSRKPLLDYYQELLDEPDRMVAVFDTMKPVRDEKNKITGYVVGLEGEKDFFDAVGLQQGDIVRAVNSVPMTHRRRAESFIDQFLKDSLNAVVLEVERGGKVTKQVYQMRP
jgi:type II secretory pathway component PulC